MSIARQLGCLVLTATMLLAGCTSVPGPLRKLPVFRNKAEEQTLRKQVEADKFPSAKQAGL